jgi:hypothetical protein
VSCIVLPGIDVVPTGRSSRSPLFRLESVFPL